MLERFALARVIYGKPEMVKSESYGQWVRYSDALELQAENAALKSYLSGISPDRLQEICAAEAEGRVVVLPCMIGDTVYALQSMRISELCVDPLHKEIVTAKVIEITLKDGIEWLRLYSDDDRIADYRGTEWGKTVFLTKEQAEAALGKGDTE